MKGFGVRYLCTLASRNLSGSNVKAMSGAVSVYVSALGKTMTRTVWAPEIRAAVNVHHRVNAAVLEDSVTLLWRQTPNGENARGICRDVNRRLTIRSRQNHGLSAGPRVDRARTALFENCVYDLDKKHLHRWVKSENLWKAKSIVALHAKI